MLQLSDFGLSRALQRSEQAQTFVGNASAQHCLSHCGDVYRSRWRSVRAAHAHDQLHGSRVRFSSSFIKSTVTGQRCSDS